MPTKVLTMFQPDPGANQVPPTGFRLETAPSPSGVWLEVPATFSRLKQRIDCDLLSSTALGEGNCYAVTATAADTDTHARAVAVATIDGTVVSVPGNVIPLPEPKVSDALVIGVILIGMAWAARGRR